MGNKIHSCFNIDDDIDNIMSLENLSQEHTFGTNYDGKKSLFSEWWTFYFYGDNDKTPYGMINYIIFRPVSGAVILAVYPAIMIPNEYKRITSMHIAPIDSKSIGINTTSIVSGKNSIEYSNGIYYIKGAVDEYSWEFTAMKAHNSIRPYYVAKNIDLVADQKLTFISQLPGGICTGELCCGKESHIIQSKCEIEHLYGTLLLDTLKWTMSHGYDLNTNTLFYFLDTPEKGAFVLQQGSKIYRVTSKIYHKEIINSPDEDYPLELRLVGLDPLLGSFSINIKVIGISASERGSASELLAWITVTSNANSFIEYSGANSITFTGILEYYESGASNIIAKIYENVRKLVKK